MKSKVFFCLVLLPGVIRSEVFKCEAVDGTVSYQQQECSTAAMQSTMAFEKPDQERVSQAQQKLNQELQEREQLEAQRAEQERKNREVDIMEQRARYEQEMINQTKLQTQAIQENTATMEKRKYSDRVYLGRPYYPVAKPPITKPIVKPHPVPKPLGTRIQ